MTDIYLVIFDLDGVLVDSEPMYRDMNLRYLKSKGGDISTLNYDLYVGIHAAEMWRDLKQRFALAPSVEELVFMEKDAKFNLLQNAELKPVHGALDLLTRLSAHGMNLAVASSSMRANVDLILHRLEIHLYFDHVVCGDEIEHGKPAPDIFLKAAAQFNIPPESCCVIEDSSNGILAANRAGMTSLGYSSPASGQQDLSKADLVVTDLDQINMAMFQA